MRQLASLILLSVATASAQTDLFETRVRPLFVAKCQGCHNSRTKTAGLDLSAAIAAPQRLLEVTSYEGKIKMPPAGKLAPAEIAALTDWVRAGAVWPATPVRASGDHWAFRPLASSKGQSIDSFLQAKLKEQKLRPAPRTDKLTLLRRAAFDLTGLPPTADDTRLFLADKSPQAFAKAIDRFLDSPRYGEKWGRHWLDVARYADSTGADEDYRYPYAWRYRDYVIDAFNRDVPYPQFVREQIAGDLLPPPAGQEVNVTGIVATGFLALGPKLVAEQDKVKMFYDIVDEQIDVVGKTFLGLTISCARCHDHKFDPITTKDYYSLASIFASTRQLEQIEGTVSSLFYVPLSGKAEADRYAEHQKKIAAKQREIDGAIGTQASAYRKKMAPQIAVYMLAARRIYQDGAAVPADLDQAALQRWVDYLKPSKERRPHLEAWYKAASPEAAAAEYQANYFAEVELRAKSKAKFPAGANRFYTEITGAKGTLGLPEKQPEKFYTPEAIAKLAKLRGELADLKKASPAEPPMACAVAEDKPVEQHVFLRGNPASHGDLVAKRFPAVLAGNAQPAIEKGSGRKELAEWLANPANPLVARVIVNRIWQGHFGQGLVRTSNNFGIAGEKPSHPELLDWLAAQFAARGSSIKAMHRLIMLSNAYQMSSDSTAEQRDRDADNRLLTRFTMRRKTVEEIRDSLLMLDGSIDFTMGGALATGKGTDNEFSDGRKSMHPDDSKRRTVYLPLRRSNLSTLFTLFDFGDGTTSTEMREQTNVAPQALYMMNSKFVAERTRTLAQRLLAEDGNRIAKAYRTVLGREPLAQEVSSSMEYLKGFPKLPASDGDGQLLAWASLCRTLIASNEFIYVQ